MRYGFVLPGGTATEQLERAVLADRASWDGAVEATGWHTWAAQQLQARSSRPHRRPPPATEHAAR